MDKSLLYDVCCGAGGATKGYQRAGFRVIGIDNKPQKHYCGDGFILMDALEFLDRYNAGEFERAQAFHTSPPCQPYIRMRKLLQSQHKARVYPELIEPIRERLIATGLPYVIENVPGAPLLAPIVLCGSSFGLKVQRHRLFESNVPMLMPHCAHYWQGKENLPSLSLHRLQGGHSRVVGCYGNGRGKGDNKALWSEALGITWMIRKELAQAIPPAYTEYIGKYLIGR